MSFSFPILSQGSMHIVSGALSTQAMAMFPARLEFGYTSRVIKFIDDSEQRWLARNKLFAATLQYHGVNGYDFALIKGLFNSMQGRYVDVNLINTFSFVIQGNTYNYCVFNQDEIVDTIGAGETHSFQLTLRQVAPNSAH